MSAIVLFNLLNNLRKRDKMRGLPSEKGISVLATILIIVHQTKPIFGHDQ